MLVCPLGCVCLVPTAKPARCCPTPAGATWPPACWSLAGGQPSLSCSWTALRSPLRARASRCSASASWRCSPPARVSAASRHATSSAGPPLCMACKPVTPPASRCWQARLARVPLHRTPACLYRAQRCPAKRARVCATCPYHADTANLAAFVTVSTIRSRIDNIGVRARLSHLGTRTTAPAFQAARPRALTAACHARSGCPAHVLPD